MTKIARPSIAAVVLTHPRSPTLSTSLETLGGLDEVVVLETDAAGSSPAPLSAGESARGNGWERCLEAAAARTTADWLLLLHDDEALDPADCAALRTAVNTPGIECYPLPVTYRLGRARLRSPGLGTRRLVARQAVGRWRTARAGPPPTSLSQLGDGTVREMVDKLNRLSSAEADERRRDLGARAAERLWRDAALAFGHGWLRDGALRDGLDGYVGACLLAAHAFLTNAKIWEQACPADDLAPPTAVLRNWVRSGRFGYAVVPPWLEPGAAPSESTATVSAVLTVKNVESILGACLRSWSFCDELIVIDDGSTDGTVAIAEQHGARVFHRRLDRFDTQRNFGIEQARSEWILIVDADEIALPGFAADVRRAIGYPTAPDAYWIPRFNQFFGRWAKWGGWCETLPRLFRSHLRLQGAIHDLVDAPYSGAIPTPILHYPGSDLTWQIAKVNQYSSTDALVRADRRDWFAAPKLVLAPPYEFYCRYLRREGYRDGTPGLVLAMISAFTFLIERAKAREVGHHA